MAQAVVIVLILLLFVAYAVLFSMWNIGAISVVGFVWGQPWGMEVPVFVLPLAGVFIGAIVMAIAVSAPWSSLKSKLAAAQDQLEAERSRSRECARKLETLKERLQDRQAQTQPTPKAAEADTDEDLSPPEGEQ